MDFVTGSMRRRVPFRSVTRMRVSGRKAKAQGSEKSVMGVVLKGCWRVDRWGDRAEAVVDRDRARARAEVRERVGYIVEAVVEVLDI